MVAVAEAASAAAALVFVAAPVCVFEPPAPADFVAPAAFVFVLVTNVDGVPVPAALAIPEPAAEEPPAAFIWPERICYQGKRG